MSYELRIDECITPKTLILKEGERGYWAACREAACQRITETLPKVLERYLFIRNC